MAKKEFMTVVSIKEKPVQYCGLRNNVDIYFILTDSGNALKIGQTTTGWIRRRIKQLQSISPDKLILIDIITNIQGRYENKIHKLFKSYLLHHEWFDPAILQDGMFKVYIKHLKKIKNYL